MHELLYIFKKMSYSCQQMFGSFIRYSCQRIQLQTIGQDRKQNTIYEIKNIIYFVLVLLMTTHIHTQHTNSRLRTFLKSEYFNNHHQPTPPLQDFLHHPSNLAIFITNIRNQHANKYKIYKWIAMATFLHPVLITHSLPILEQLLANNSIFTNAQTAQAINSTLEAANILALIRGFDLRILNLKQRPQLAQNNDYQLALWINLLKHFPKTTDLTHYISQTQQSITSDAVNELKIFLNGIFDMKKQVNESIGEIILKQEMALTQQQKLFIHPIDLEISSWSGITLAEYLPEDYKNEYIEIWVDRTVELNSLLGNFICKEKFGEFEYVKGPLAHAMENGIMLLLNNFQQISNELLVNIQILTQQMRVYHNQKIIKAKGGFRVLGLCNMEQLSTKSRTRILNNQYIRILKQSKRNILLNLPPIENETNRSYITELLGIHQEKYGYLSACKFWNRIERCRKTYVEPGHDLWETYFTESFKSEINLDIHDLANTSEHQRTIAYEERFKQVKLGRVLVDTSRAEKFIDRIVKTQYSLAILQKLALCMELGETPLLISETGCGKTTLVQYLAQIYGHQLFVYNMSSGTDAMDLVGGFKPIDCRMLLKQLFYRFIQKFREIPGSQKNESYIQNLVQMYQSNQLNRLLPSLVASISKIKQKVTQQKQTRQWNQLSHKFNNIHSNLDKIDSNLVFSFIEGNLIKAMKNGDWVLIDEINLASNDILQKVVPLIEGKSLLLYEKGDLNFIERHPDFRIVGCMNPANDSGKKALPSNLYEKFTAMSLQQPSKLDIQLMVQEISPQLSPSQISKIYFQVKKHKTISLRNLSRCLAYLNRNKEIYTFKRALYDALILGFQEKRILKQYQDLTIPKNMQGFTQIQGFLVQTGDYVHQGEPEVFHLTDTFKEHLKDFLRAIAGTELPVLLEGPTSAGKTSIIRYVASIAGFKCVRINNHQHTQIEQYLGNYFPDNQGKLVFRQGPLVQAVRQGYWLILDELNLARTQILECLNRLLDDNRQLFIPEQQKHIKPHKNFRIFATQNPSSYSGRKTLSRAFRNRFIALNFQDITIEDTMAIMKVRRPILADSKELFIYVKKVLETLQNYRSKQRVFSKDGIITIRDLLKWTGRKFSDKESFMREGYALLAQRLRSEAHQEKKFVENVLLTNIKCKQIGMQAQYERVVQVELPEQIINKSKIYVQMNNSFKRMAALTFKAISNQEPVLLVGETGCGKTTLAELIASISDRKFYSINCHKHTEASDLLGSLRPCTRIDSPNKFEFVNGVVINAMIDGAVLLIDEINTAEDSVLERLNQLLESNEIGVERGSGWETIKANRGFSIIATMNPSGDYGKKQLSPALRNRFTQIWVEPITHPEYLLSAKKDIVDMILHKLAISKDPQVPKNNTLIAELLFEFLEKYNCELGPQNGLSKKLLTMRDINWICKFIAQANIEGWLLRYYWGLKILALEGLNFMISEMKDYASKLQTMKIQLTHFINRQVKGICSSFTIQSSSSELQVIDIIKHLAFPLLIKTDLPLELLGITPNQRIFFSAHTELTDLLGQFHPQGQNFVWNDQVLLQCVKQGKSVALFDMNLAQQQVIEGINSLFDYRGSLFIIQLNETYTKHQNFRSIVVLKQTNIINDRKGLPNSFLNRFIKIRVQDVSKQKKLHYLRNKYQTLNEQCFILIDILLDSVKIQLLEYVCQMMVSGYMRNAIRILNLSREDLQQQLKKYSEESLETLEQENGTHFNYHEEIIMQLLPLQEMNLSDVGSLVNSYLTLVNTNFSVCLIGPMLQRQAITKSLGYLLGKQINKVILSTMTDMAQLLGSYEQVDSNTSENESPNSKQATFQYVKSRIIKTLEHPQDSLLYIQVPNQSMLQRLEKGIKILYEQRVQVIVGINSLTSSTLSSDPNTSYIYRSNTKFIPVELKEVLSLKLGIEFIPNYSQLKHRDCELRIEELTTSIKTQISNTGDRNKVRAWQKLYQLLCNPNIESSFKNCKLGYEESDYQRIWNNQVHKYGDNQLYSTFNYQNFKSLMSSGVYVPHTQVIKNIPKTEQQLIVLTNILLFTQSGSHHLDPSLLYTRPSSMQEQSSINLKPHKKFQCIFLSEANKLFKQQSCKLLALLYNNLTNLSLFQKFYQQTQHIFNDAISTVHSQLLIRFNEEQYKIIPILNNPFSFYYYILSNSETFDSFNKLFLGNVLSFESVLGTQNHEEKSMIEYMECLRIQVRDCGEWLAKMHVRELGLYNILQHNLYSVFKNGENRVKQIVSIFTENQGFSKIIKLQKEKIMCDEQEESQNYTLGYLIFNAFKPLLDQNSQFSPLNLLPHIKTQLHLQSLQELSQQSEFFTQVYQQIVTTKYSSYTPQSFKYVQKNRQHFQNQIIATKKQYIYRGHDNIRLLIDFYEKLCAMCCRLEGELENLEFVKKVMVELYENYYVQYRDILWPLLCGLILIYETKKEQKQQQKEKNRPVTLNLIEPNKPFLQSLELVLTRQEEEFRDDAKDYTKFQRKFNKTVIVDEYSQEGVQQNKANDEQEFREFFGKNQSMADDESKDKMGLLEELYSLIRRQHPGDHLLTIKKNILKACTNSRQLAIGMQLQYSYSKAQNKKLPILNIYEQTNTSIIQELTAPVNSILIQLKALLKKYNIDNFKVLGTLSNKILEHRVNQQVYKVLADCQFLTDKIFEINAILPSKQRIDTEEIVKQCLKIRRIQLKNWKSMLEYKVRRIEKSDTLQFITFYRKFTMIGSLDSDSPEKQQKICFQLCDQFLSHSKLSCYDFRLHLLRILSSNIPQIHLKASINRVIGFYIYLKDAVSEQWQTIKKQKMKEVEEYEKLTSWNSNEYLIFKATCEKFQRKIHHILKRYEEELSMQVGNLHQVLRGKQICGSIPQFETVHLSLCPKNQSVSENVIKIEETVSQIFKTIKDIKEEHHNTQSRLLSIRNGLGDLQNFTMQFTESASLNKDFYASRVIVQEMFDSDDLYKRAVKYYYGIWDKLCQKTQSAWNRELIQRFWGVAEKLWLVINSRIPQQDYNISTELDDETENLIILYEKYLGEDISSDNTVFQEQVQRVKLFLEEKQNQYHRRLLLKYPLIQNCEEIVSLMKLGYIVACVALNLEKNGLCVKENEQENQNNEEEEIGDGMGIGEGEAHQGAQNIGDQIEFEEQVLGNKNQQKNDDANANKKEEQDIEMQEDFEGQMYSKEQQNEEEEGEEKEADQQMGDVDKKEREQDMKNQEGQAQGKQQEDIEIEGQKEGDSELVDNEQQDKEARKDQNKNKQDDDEAEEQQQKSDWDDNNQQGDKINKRNPGEEQQQQDEQNDNDKPPESISGDDKQDLQGAEENGEMQEQPDPNKSVDQSKSIEEDNEMEEEQNDDKNAQFNEMENEGQQPEQQSEKEDQDNKVHRTRKTNLQAYGRSDLNSNNPIKNMEENMDNQQNQGGRDSQEAQGANDETGGKNSNTIHSLSAQLLKQIQNLQRKMGNRDNFMKDLNVMEHDQNAQQQKNQENNQQYELTQQNNKATTNLPAFLDGDEPKQEKQEQKQKEQERKQGKDKEKDAKKQMKEKESNEEKKQKQQKVSEKTQKKQEQIGDDKLGGNDNREQKIKKQKEEKKNDAKKVEKSVVMQDSVEQDYLRRIVEDSRKIKGEVIDIEKDDQNQNNVLEQAYQVSKILEEQLKSVLEPLDVSEYSGDFKTGKKLNLKKIIPFIASNYKKDRIWLRRVEPSDRNYYIMLALDDTKSMLYGDVGNQALKGLLAISIALQNLNIKTCITGIKDTMHVFKKFEQLMDINHIIKQFNFQHESKVSHDLSIASFVGASLQEFSSHESTQAGVENKQLCFIISDGKMNKDYVRPYLKDAKSKNIIYVFIIIDSESNSILTTRSAVMEEGKVKMKLYMSDFPFEYFLIVRNVRQMGEVLALALMQFIQQK